MRDYVGELRKLIDGATAGQVAYSAPRVAHDLVTILREKDPALLAGWLDQQAETFVARSIAERDRSIRAHARRRRPGVDFATAVARHNAGVPNAFSEWLDSPWTVGGVRKPLRLMTAADLRAAAGSYLRQAEGNAKNARFLIAVERIVDAHQDAETVEDCIGEDELVRLWGKVDELPDVDPDQVD